MAVSVAADLLRNLAPGKIENREAAHDLASRVHTR